MVLPACRELWQAAVLLAFIDNITLADINMTLTATTLTTPSINLIQSWDLPECTCVYVRVNDEVSERFTVCLCVFVCVHAPYPLPDPRTLFPKVDAQRQATCSLQETVS